jgi:hypothetical protein
MQNDQTEQRDQKDQGTNAPGYTDDAMDSSNLEE